ncbi:hydrogenase maturation nickel metallochaperone HypA [Desulfuromonas sp. AOP6]|uniref:hydrogenase maturation nickel metallochaperone HypA n=1 Tax=Desulfuromonas sp. AOP6 TaxID=1566351 RepID=UPI001282D411|nr:hydrogenase maturation nickel metallochaperone HypA [Desulfuromonas sp. AOP6]BCA79366.1 putative hydrogenase nickel incorporation protein HypA [Desulfuromonas sp. AOP6]
MHELGITQSIVDIAQAHALEQGAQKVLQVRVAIGALSGVMPDAVAFCFEACCKNTFLEHSKLLIDHIPGKGHCLQCGKEISMDILTISCPHCGSFTLETLTGNELSIQEMEIE